MMKRAYSKKKALTVKEMASLGGRARAEALKPEEVEAIGRKGGKAFWQKIWDQVDDKDHWLMVTEAAQQLGMSVGNLRYLSLKGMIPFKTVSLGKRTCRIYREKDILAYQKQNPYK